MRITIKHHFFFFSLSAACFSMATNFSDEQFSKEVYSPLADANDCREYEQRGMDFTVCLWRRLFPSFSELNLSDRNAIYTFAMPYCERFKNSEPSNLSPDIEGRFCLENNQPASLEALRAKDPKRAAICAKYELVKIYWRAKALTLFKGIMVSADASALFDRETQLNSLAKLAIWGQYKELLDLNPKFPARKSTDTYWPRTSMVDNALLLLLVAGFGNILVR